MKKLLLAGVAAAMLSGVATASDIGVGAVLSFNTQGDVSFGPRVFTSKKAKKWVASGGLNYNFMTKGFEPVVGVGYTFKDGFVGGEIAFSFSDGAPNFAAAAGWSNAKKQVACPAGQTRDSLGICG